MLAAWLFWKERQTNRDKETGASNAYTREQKRSLAAFDEASEKTALSQVLQSFSELVKHTIDSNNGHLSKLTEDVIKGFKDADTSTTGGTKDVMARLERIEASQNQIVIFLRDRAGQSLAGGSEGQIGAATIRSDAQQRAAGIVNQADVSMQADKDASHAMPPAEPAQPQSTPVAPRAEKGPKVIAIVEALPPGDKQGEQ